MPTIAAKVETKKRGETATTTETTVEKEKDDTKRSGPKTRSKAAVEASDIQNKKGLVTETKKRNTAPALEINPTKVVCPEFPCVRCKNSF